MKGRFLDMAVVKVELKPIVGDKKASDYFWSQVEKSGKPTEKALEKLKSRLSKEKSLTVSK